MNTIKWLQKLSREELYELHKKCIYSDIENRCDVYKGKYKLVCTFYEKWGDAGYIPTSYDYTDFSITAKSYFEENEREANATLVKEMTKRFGVEYIKDLLQFHTEVPVTFWNSVLR